MSATTSRSFSRSLDDEVQFLKGVGPKNSQLLGKAGIKTVRDLLYYLPRRYEDRTNLPPINRIKAGEHVTIRGKLMGMDNKHTRGGLVLLKAMVNDGTGTVALLWFNQPWIARKLQDFKGEIIAYGLAKESGWAFEIQNPEYELIEPEDSAEEFSRIVPVYPLVEGLPQRVVRRAAQSALTLYVPSIRDPLPAYLLKEYKLKPLAWSLEQVHRPSSDQERVEARRRLVFEEFLYLQLALALQRQKVHREPGISVPVTNLGGWSGEFADEDKKTPHSSAQSAHTLPLKGGGRDSDAQSAHSPRKGGGLSPEVSKMLPFTLTNAQRRVIKEIWRDMESPHPMNRLLQGDVGSGKTAVAAAAMLAAVRAGYQTALMAPTEVLAEQHYITFHQLIDPLGIKCELMVGKLTDAQREKARTHAQTGEAEIFLGTHALIQEGVEFKNLGLVVIDEQHRFGVMQRLALRGKGMGNPDVLVMTATPIPRTLTMTLYGDLDLSVLDEMPPGRRPVKTHWKQPSERNKTYEGVRKLIENGKQAYFVCPLVSESEKMQAQAAEDLHYQLSKEVFPNLEVGLLHGQMRPKQKEEVMDRFRRGEIGILVATTVIEVGVDVPNASAMVVEDANRFGLSQLHQLRGRVGRSSAQSYCVLIADATTEEAQSRLRIMTETYDGFKIAEEDLRIRGPGELMGTKQHGSLGLKVADLIQDGKMLEVARQAALKIMEVDPTLSRPEHRPLLESAVAHRTGIAAIAVS